MSRVSILPDAADNPLHFAVDRNRAHLARRLQPHPDGAIEALMYDINLIAGAACDELVVGAGYRVRTHEDDGGWRGRCIRQTGPDRVSRPVLAVRTWPDR
jgi:hypothetical protein